MTRLSALTIIPMALVLVFSGCDELENPIVEITTAYQATAYGPAPAFSALSIAEATQRVLIEDFTAHQCGNCPAAAIIAAQIAEDTGDAVSVMAIHAGNLANTDDDHFDTDWTTEEGNLFWDQLDFQANPLGRINRIGGPGNFWAPAQWSDQTAEQLNTELSVGLQVIHDWVPENDHLNVHVHGTFYADADGPIQVALLILESDVYDYQLDYASDPELVPDYEFDHVLRSSVHGAFGLGFGDVATGAGAGDVASHSVTYTWDNAWVVENATVLVVVSDGNGLVLNSFEFHPAD
ncbi:MAG: Omp28-related outer membrane protein [Bacteroidetes bacterium]|jgi:thiol-disulfide isomerase/thioredoxin|nr:Omp28-related outer membrane protein [Bacteroidota bacterium]